jgi:hypothetical protein
MEQITSHVTIEGESLMKKKIMIVSLLVLVLTLAFSTSVALADKPPTTVGVKINIVDGMNIEFPAGDPFHIMHGFISGFEITEPVGNVVARSKMVLEVDGVEIDPDYVTIDWVNYIPDYPFLVATKLFTFNFPDGMTDEHTFTRRYFFTCQSYWNMGIQVDCKNPAELIEDPYWEQTIQVTFVE